MWLYVIIIVIKMFSIDLLYKMLYKIVEKKICFIIINVYVGFLNLMFFKYCIIFKMFLCIFGLNFFERFNLRFLIFLQFFKLFMFLRYLFNVFFMVFLFNGFFKIVLIFLYLYLFIVLVFLLVCLLGFVLYKSRIIIFV